MLKVLAACGNGMGSSQIIKMRIEQVLKEMGLDFSVDHASVGEAKGQAKNYDLVLVANQLVKEFQNVPESCKVVGLINLLSAQEIKEKVMIALDL
jgi:PTS system ascorbate-specific IIB component